ncbi:MAG: ATPase [Bacteroidetes bacterium 4572_117]|nr:MAG: ATPase [Bacteroidetes bacterium 4572_117]
MKGVQVDLIINRRDNIINLCEIKFSINPFIINKKYAGELRNKIGTFKAETGTRKSVFLTMLTTYGVKQNIFSTGLFQNETKMDDLFIGIGFQV